MNKEEELIHYLKSTHFLDIPNIIPLLTHLAEETGNEAAYLLCKHIEHTNIPRLWRLLERAETEIIDLHNKEEDYDDSNYQGRIGIEGLIKDIQIDILTKEELIERLEAIYSNLSEV